MTIHFRRIELRYVNSVLEVGEGPPGLVVVDLQNTVMPHGATARDVRSAAMELEKLQTKLGSDRRLVVATNASHRAVSVKAFTEVYTGKIVTSAHKPSLRPWKNKSVVAVIGDQVTTDGLLAWRTGCPFFLVASRSKKIPLVTRIHLLLGKVLVRVAFVVKGD